MSISKNNPQPKQRSKPDEKILVVPAMRLFPQETIQGFQPLSAFDAYAQLIRSNKQFLWRSEMEEDPTYKQIIPYLIFNFEDKFFLMRRKGTASEQRLKNKYTLGIGGHIRQDDLSSDDIVDWAQREFHEEVNYKGALSIRPLGVINDESNAVGKVHTGFAFLLTGLNANISIKSELNEGSLLTLEQCNEHYAAMETWSQFVFDHLKETFVYAKNN